MKKRQTSEFIRQDRLIYEFLSELPALHTWDSGKTWDLGGFVELDLIWLLDICSKFENPRIIETGAGLYTIAFLLSCPSAVLSIAPDSDLRNRIYAFLKESNISKKKLNFLVARSEEFLPRLSVRKKFQIGLIDGNHGWPIPFIDFYYMNRVLDQGAILILNDLHLHSVGELARFLSRQDQWEVFGGAPNQRTIAFTKRTIGFGMGDWSDQPYITEHLESQSFGFANYGLGVDLTVFDIGSLHGGPCT